MSKSRGEVDTTPVYTQSAHKGKLKSMFGADVCWVLSELRREVLLEGCLEGDRDVQGAVPYLCVREHIYIVKFV